MDYDPKKYSCLLRFLSKFKIVMLIGFPQFLLVQSLKSTMLIVPSSSNSIALYFSFPNYPFQWNWTSHSLSPKLDQNFHVVAKSMIIEVAVLNDFLSVLSRSWSVRNARCLGKPSDPFDEVILIVFAIFVGVHDEEWCVSVLISHFFV